MPDLSFDVEALASGGDNLRRLADSLDQVARGLGGVDGRSATASVDVDTAPARAALDDVVQEAEDAGEEAADGFAGGFGGLAGKLAGIGAAVGGGFALAYSTAMDLGNSQALLAAQLGKSAEQSKVYGAQAGRLFAGAYGDSLDQVNEAVVAVTNNVGTWAGSSQDDVDMVTKTVLNLSSAFGTDLSESTNAVGQLMRNGMAPNATAALDLITAGLQSGLDRGGDFVGTFAESSGIFSRFGIDGSTAIGIMKQGFDAGAPSAEFFVGMLEELAGNAGDSAEVFTQLGLNGTQMAADLSAGGERSKVALQALLDGLRAVEDPSERAALMVGLFGEESASMQQALLAIDPSAAINGLDGMAGAAARLDTTLGSTAGANLEMFKRGLQTAFVDIVGGQVLPAVQYLAGLLGTVLGPAFVTAGTVIGTGIVPALQTAGTWIQNNASWLLPLVVTIGSLVLAANAATIATSVWGAVTAGTASTMGIVRGATMAWTGVQWLLNAALAANPITLVVVVLGALVAGLVTAYQTSETFRGIVDGALRAVGDTINSVVGWFAEFPTHVSNAFGAVGSFFSGLPGQIVAALGFLAGSLVRAAIDGWAGFTSGITQGFTATVAFVQSIPGQVILFLAGLPGLLASAGTSALTGFTGGVTTGWQSAAAWFLSVPGMIAGFFAAAPGWLTRTGIDIVMGLINGLTSMVSGVVGFFTGLVDQFIGGFKAGLGISSPSTVFYQFALDILNGLLNGLRSLAGVVGQFVVDLGNNIVALFQGGVNALVGLWSGFWTGLQGVAAGAYNAISSAISAWWSGLMATFTSFFASLGGGWSAWWTGLQATASNIFNGIRVVIDTVWTIIRGLFVTFIQLVTGDWQGAWNTLQAVAAFSFAAIRAGIDAVWAGIVAAFSGAMAFVSGAWNGFWTGLQAVATAIYNAIASGVSAWWSGVQTNFTNAQAFLSAAWSAFWNAVQAAAQFVIDAILRSVQFWWGLVQGAFTAAQGFLSAAWSAFWSGVQAVAQAIFDAIGRSVQFWWGLIQGAFSAGQAFVTGAWNALFTTLRTVADSVMNTIRGGLEGALSAVQTAFQNAVGFIGRVWDGVKRVTRDPIQAVIDVVYNNGIAKVWNFVAGIVKLPGLPTYNMPNFHEGGPVRQGRPGGRDDVLARVEHGEHMLTREDVEGAGGHGNVFALRKLMRGGQVRSLLNAGTTVEGADHDGPGISASGFGGVQPHVARAGHYLKNRFGIGVVGGVGARPNASDHPAGLALDFMTRGENGTALSNHLFANWNHFATKYVIWKQRIANAPNAWRAMADRGGDTANHFDHVHVSFTGTPGQGGSAVGAPPPFDPIGFLMNAVGIDLRGIENKLATGSPWIDAAKNMAGQMARGAWDWAIGKLAAWGGGIGNAVGGAVDQIGQVFGVGVRADVQRVAGRYGWGDGPQWGALNRLVEKESSWRVDADNPNSSAYGLFQQMESIHGPAPRNAAGQAEWGLNYIRQRYGDPIRALAFHDRNNYYANGAVVRRPTFGVIGESGPEVVLPLNRPSRANALLGQAGLTGGTPVESSSVVAEKLDALYDMLERRGAGASVVVQDRSGDPAETARSTVLALRLS